MKRSASDIEIYEHLCKMGHFDLAERYFSKDFEKLEDKGIESSETLLPSNS